MKTFFKELGLKQDEYVVYCDSQSAIDLSRMPPITPGQSLLKSNIIGFVMLQK